MLLFERLIHTPKEDMMASLLHPGDMLACEERTQLTQFPQDHNCQMSFLKGTNVHRRSIFILDIHSVRHGSLSKGILLPYSRSMSRNEQI